MSRKFVALAKEFIGKAPLTKLPTPSVLSNSI